MARASIYVLHDLADLDLDRGTAGFDVVVTGHSHVAEIEQRDGVLFLNPGNAGPQRFALPVTLAVLRHTEDGHVEADLIDIVASAS